MFEPEKWLQLGIAGALSFVLFAALVLFARALSEARKSHSESDTRWSQTVDRIATRYDETQKETNTIMRDLAKVMNRVEAKVDGKGRAA